MGEGEYAAEPLQQAVAPEAAEAEGQGYAREALAAVCRFGFGPPVEAQRLLIRCFADNLRAQAVARALGFQPQELPASELPAWLRLSFWDSRPPQPAILHFVRTKVAGDHEDAS